jgi:predicted lipoprotein with Yx(FWY)xxD motif
MSGKLRSPRSLSITLGTGCALVALFVACGEDADPGAGSAAGSGGTAAEGGEGNEASSVGGSSKGGKSSGGAANGKGGTKSSGSGGDGGQASSEGGASGAESSGAGAAGGHEDLARFCVYNDDVAAAGGAGGGSGDGPDISITHHPVLGPILVDSAGLTLYTVGRDSPGDCDFPPETDCVTEECLKAWPVFYASHGTLGPGLDEALFGTYERPDGTLQTTYYGWPLYYYANDTSVGQIAGQGKQGLWHAAEVKPPLIVTMRAPGTSVNYLAAANGRSLYIHASDTLGDESDPPKSACTNECLKEHPPLLSNSLTVVSSLEPADFTLFQRADGVGLQVAYKGAPLYFDVTAKKPGKIADPLPNDWELALK